MHQLSNNRRIIKESLSEILQAARDAEKVILDRVLNSLDSYTTRGGSFVPEISDKKIIARLQPQLQRALNDADFENSLLRFFDDFDEIGKNVANIHNQVNDIKISPKILLNEKEIIIDETLTNLLTAKQNQHFLIPVKQGLFNRIRLGASVTETEAFIRQLIQGDDNLGVIEKWVGQVARDSVNQYMGAIHQKVKNEFKLEHWAYLGGLVTDSRPQCIRWVGMGTIPDKNLESEISWAFRRGAGMILGTDTTNFGIYRGGWNCLHEAIPTNKKVKL